MLLKLTRELPIAPIVGEGPAMILNIEINENERCTDFQLIFNGESGGFKSPTLKQILKAMQDLAWLLKLASPSDTNSNRLWGGRPYSDSPARPGTRL